ncbi:ABC transporter ATP-binding protein [Bacillus sp. 2205SS5-2]|uniref:ABC transporter ATP-binding protein n=1 Tax=Bacillus sp. 2205SS5-2 TaxID=3109031 RepID=UPI0030072576
MNVLELHSISHLYFTTKSVVNALEDVSLTVTEGEFISLIGPSGCGKTTLLSIIAGLLEPTRGTVSIPENNSIGYMLQQDYLYPWKTIEENILLGLKIDLQLDEKHKKYALSLLSEMGLQGTENQFPRQLSGGMRQRAALVRTLALSPKLLLLDEPFSALDYQTKLKLENLVVQTLKQLNKSAVLVTHDISEAIAMSDRILLFSPRPGRLYKEFNIPTAIRELSPFEARNSADFSLLFAEVWKEMENIEKQ